VPRRTTVLAAVAWSLTACLAVSCTSSADEKTLDTEGVSCADVLTTAELTEYGVPLGGEYPEGLTGPRHEDFSMCSWNSGPNGRYILNIAIDRTERSNQSVGQEEAAETMRGYRTSQGKTNGHDFVHIATGPDTGTIKVWGTTRRPIGSIARHVLDYLISVNS
jgi:hypothetical protein